MEITIDFGRCLGGTFSALARYFGSFLVLIVGWAFLGVAVFFATHIAIAAAMEQLPEFGSAVANLGEHGIELLSILPLIFVAVPGTVSMVVGWHRRIIQGIVPSSPFPVSLGSIFAYLWRGLIAFGIPGVPYILSIVALSTLTRAPGSPLPVAATIWFFVGLIAASLIAMRLSVMLPAIAVGDRSITVSRAWSLTKGNTLRLFFGAFLAALPFSIAGNICEKIAEAPSVIESGWAALAILVGVLVEFMSYAAVAGFFSLAYIQLRDALNDVPIADPLSVGTMAP